jgi:hypothetical protein
VGVPEPVMLVFVGVPTVEVDSKVETSGVGVSGTTGPRPKL